jgi:hypothetical protein
VEAPKCEALREACVANEESRATIHPAEWTLKPPVGWTFAQEGDGAVALAPGAAFAISSYQAAAGKKEAAARDEAFARVRTKLSVKLASTKKLPWAKKPDQVMTVGTISVALYQMDGATREAKKGPLLVFLAPLPDKRFLIGAGFVPDDDATDADHAILKTIESLAPPSTEDAAKTPPTEAPKSP